MSDRPIEEHDRGLQHDLETMARRMKERRRVLGWIASSGAVALIASCGGGSSDSSSGTSVASSSSSGDTSTSTSTSGSCIADPEETQGPYPADGSNSVNGTVSNVLSQSGVVRSDIRSSFGDYTGTAEGVELQLTVTLVNVNDSCSPLEGYAIYIWHCNRSGEYSLYSSDIQDENYLRGVQVTDSNGQITITSIFPACYSGRYPHIHFEVYPSLDTATSYTNKLLTSQMALPREICSTVYASATGYSASVSNLAAVTTSSDGVFGDNTSAQLAAQTPSLSGSVSAGYTGTLTIGVAL